MKPHFKVKIVSVERKTYEDKPYYVLWVQMDGEPRTIKVNFYGDGVPSVGQIVDCHVYRRKDEHFGVYVSLQQ